jgi:uncharacterized phage protein (TIGR01671 family)
MKREILFRGRALNTMHNGKWIYGWLTKEDDDFYITNDENFYPVENNTIGQFTGLTDKNGTKIFEGDTIRVTLSNKFTQVGIVEYTTSESRVALFGWRTDEYFWKFTYDEDMEVIGNIHDSPELIGGAK